MKSTVFGPPVWSDGSQAPRFSSPLMTDEDVDVAIVGAGLLGLSSALHAARLGSSVRVIEAQTIANGASGRNGGQVIPGLKYDPDWLINHFGPKRGERLIDFVSKTADVVFDLIKSEITQCCAPPFRLDLCGTHRKRYRIGGQPEPPMDRKRCGCTAS